jgi:phospholipase A1
MFFLLFLSFSSDAAEIADRVAECAKIKDDAAARLECFDNLAKQQTPMKDASPTASAATAEVPKKLSIMEKQWDLYPEKEKGIFALKPYRPNYFLPVAYNSSPNDNTALDFDPQAKAQHNEVKFQLSFKVKPFGIDLDDTKPIKGIDLWLAYTQLSFWQLYNSAFSSPFRDTNYEPELLVNFRTLYEIPGLTGTKLQFFNVGFNHQSNGRSKPISRSWNRIVANVGLEKDNFNLLLKAWYRIPENEVNDDNPYITRYLGYGELCGIYYWKGHRFAATLRNNLRSENLGAVQLDWSIPMSLIWEKLDNFSFYLQYFNGYGESLLDYNTSINRISAGVMLVDWN